MGRKGVWERDGSELTRQELPTVVPPQKQPDDAQLFNDELVWHTSCRGEGFKSLEGSLRIHDLPRRRVVSPLKASYRFTCSCGTQAAEAKGSSPLKAASGHYARMAWMQTRALRSP